MSVPTLGDGHDVRAEGALERDGAHERELDALEGPVVKRRRDISLARRAYSSLSARASASASMSTPVNAHQNSTFFAERGAHTPRKRPARPFGPPSRENPSNAPTRSAASRHRSNLSLKNPGCVMNPSAPSSRFAPCAPPPPHRAWDSPPRAASSLSYVAAASSHRTQLSQHVLARHPSPDVPARVTAHAQNSAPLDPSRRLHRSQRTPSNGGDVFARAPATVRTAAGAHARVDAASPSSASDDDDGRSGYTTPSYARDSNASRCDAKSTTGARSHKNVNERVAPTPPSPARDARRALRDARRVTAVTPRVDMRASGARARANMSRDVTNDVVPTFRLAQSFYPSSAPRRETRPIVPADVDRMRAMAFVVAVSASSSARACRGDARAMMMTRHRSPQRLFLSVVAAASRDADASSSSREGRRTSWDDRYAELALFRAMHATIELPRALDAQRRWLARQRSLARRGALSNDRRERLAELGVTFDLRKSPGTRTETTSFETRVRELAREVAAERLAKSFPRACVRG